MTLQFSDVFKCLCVGIDETDGLPGSPPVTFYMRKEELRTMMDVVELLSVFLSPLMQLSFRYAVSLPSARSLSLLFAFIQLSRTTCLSATG